MVNITLVVQTLNFFIAYYLLRFLFFKPVSLLIQQEDAVQKKQHDGIRDQQNKIAQQSELKKENWQIFQHYFKQHSPQVVGRGVIEKKVAQIKLPEASNDEIKKMREDVKKLIITKVNHVS